ncbi:hypothetical protein ACIGEZ_19735 [Streptomyces sp. NPDC085481]|uniref:hypothetical protein n=1 Tax=Streptomyces sp. NPDC085481 TaxID=3365727 RepID=UPI0037D42D37
MSIRHPQDMARFSIRRQAAGLDTEQVAAKAAGAATRQAETARATRDHDAGTELGEDPHRLAATWAAKHTQCRRVEELMATPGWEAYDPHADQAGTTREVQREQWRQQRLAAAKELRAEQRDAAHGLRTDLCPGAGPVHGLRTDLSLAAGPARRLRTATARTGRTPEQVLAQLAERVEVSPDGTLTATPFTPQTAGAPALVRRRRAGRR